MATILDVVHDNACPWCRADLGLCEVGSKAFNQGQAVWE